tara:strand:- start:1483 stop:1767 length:285 start_codon:yes stop_codon:yes gene_type:complete
MFSIIKKLQAQVLSLTQVLERLDKIEATIKQHEGFAAENDALWSYLDEEDEEVLRSAGYCRPTPARKAHSPTAEEVAAHISDEDLRTMKTQGDA